MSTVVSAVPVEAPRAEINPEYEDLFREWFYTDYVENETMSALGNAASVFHRTVLKSKTLPSRDAIQRMMERLCWNDAEAAGGFLRAGCDIDTWPVISALDAVLSRYISEHLKPRWAPGHPDWKRNAIGFTKAVGDFLNAHVEAEKANRAEKAKLAVEGPNDLAKMCAKMRPQVKKMIEDVNHLAKAFGIEGPGVSGSIREKFLFPMEQLARYLDSQIALQEKRNRSTAAQG